MAAVLEVPGVVTQEIPNEASLSVPAGETAVPLIAMSEDDAKLTPFEKMLEITSWLTFAKSVEAEVIAAGDLLSVEEAKKARVNKQKELETTKLYLCLKAYFLNGGGRCYITPVKKMQEEVKQREDVTLIVAAGEDLSSESSLFDGKSLCFALLDAVLDKDVAGKNETQTQAAKLPAQLPKATEEGKVPNTLPLSFYAAAYYPPLLADWAKDKDNHLRPIPASVVVAGLICQTDSQRGVWHAPANLPLQGGIRPQFGVSDTLNGQYGGVNANNNAKAINMIRTFRGTGALIWGTRTLDTRSDDWKYIPVRRLFSAAERDIKNAMSFAVFEPNNQLTWERVRAAIANYLYAIWRRGGLVGATTDEAYFVRIGLGVTMTEADLKAGVMKVEVGMAAAYPAEFIILQFTQMSGVS